MSGGQRRAALRTWHNGILGKSGGRGRRSRHKSQLRQRYRRHKKASRRADDRYNKRNQDGVLSTVCHTVLCFIFDFVNRQYCKLDFFMLHIFFIQNSHFAVAQPNQTRKHGIFPVNHRLVMPNDMITEAQLIEVYKFSFFYQLAVYKSLAVVIRQSYHAIFK